MDAPHGGGDQSRSKPQLGLLARTADSQSDGNGGDGRRAGYSLGSTNDPQAALLPPPLIGKNIESRLCSSKDRRAAAGTQHIATDPSYSAAACSED